MNYKAICFFDLDGTLLDEKSQVTADVVAAINKLKKNNILPMIATGRALIEAQEVIDASGMNSIVALNGLHIQIEGKTIFAQEFPREYIQPLIDKTKELGHSLSFFNEEDAWAVHTNDVFIKAFERLAAPLPKISEDLHLSQKILMPVITTDVPETDELYRQAIPGLKFYRTTPEIIDVVPHGTDKGTGVRTVLELLGAQDIPTYAFGDGSNDLALLAAVDNKIAMGNAIDELKAIADYVSANNSDGGLIQALDYYGLI